MWIAFIVVCLISLLYELIANACYKATRKAIKDSWPWEIMWDEKKIGEVVRSKK